MGGLVTRSALHSAGTDGCTEWPKRLKNIVFLGTPHHGAPLERAGNWVDTVLGSTPLPNRFRGWANCAAPALPTCATATC